MEAEGGVLLLDELLVNVATCSNFGTQPYFPEEIRHLLESVSANSPPAEVMKQEVETWLGRGGVQGGNNQQQEPSVPVLID